MLEIKIFTKPGCPKCKKAKAILDELKSEKGISYTEISTATKEGLSEAVQNNIMSLPVLFIKNDAGKTTRINSDTTKAEILKALGL